MADWRATELVRQIVAEKCRAGEMFTAFDVTREAQRRGVRQRHGHLKPIVHQCYEGGVMDSDYVRQLIDIPGADGPAWLYHRCDDEPDGYRPLARRSTVGGFVKSVTEWLF